MGTFSQKSFSIFKRDVLIFTANLITGAIIARVLGPTAMGIWVILMMIPSYAEAVGRFKLDIAAVFFLGKKKYGLGETCFMLNVLAIITSGILIAVLVWKVDFIAAYLFKDSQYSKNLIYMIALFIPVNFISTNCSYLLIYLEDVRSYNNLCLIKGLASSLLAIIFMIVFKMGVESLVTAILISGVLAITYGTWKVQRIERMIPNFNWMMIKDLFFYGSKLYLAGLVNQFNWYISGLLVALYLAPSQVAFFRMGQDKAQLINKVPDAINTILYPRISKMGNQGNSADLLAAKSFRISFLILTCLGVIGSILIKPAVIILYGRQYIPLTLSFWIMLPGIIFMGATGTLNQYFMGIGRPNIIFKISTIPLVVQILAGIIFIPIFKMVGAAVATSVTFLVISIVSLFIFKRITKISIKDIVIPTKDDFKIVLDFIREQIQKILPARFKRLATAKPI